jgi:two-component sensor histidine kinase/integral membrane sensor domain MASE1
VSYLVPSVGQSGRVTRIARAAAQRALFPLFVVGFAGAYFLAARIGIATALPPEGVVVIWPPNAIVLTALLAAPRSRWWVFFLATVATEIAADVPAYPLWAAAGYGVVNFSEAALAAFLLQRVARAALPLSRVRDFIRFVLAGPLVASGAAALFGAAIYKVGNPELDYLHYWRVFWFGDAIGLLVLGTALLAWQAPPAWWRRIGAAQAAEGSVLAIGLLATSASAFFIDHDEPAVYLIFPFLAWAALRFGIQGASAAILAAVAIAVGTAAQGVGPFADLTTIDAVTALQGLIAVVALSTFMLAFSVEESRSMANKLRREAKEHLETERQLRQARSELEAANVELDRKVRERTHDLEAALARNALLLDEVHHRIKNSLQIASSLLGLSSRDIADPQARAKLAAVQGQIGAIAATYDAIHQLGAADAVDICGVVPHLCREITRGAGELVELTTETEGPCPVTSETAVALSLALNELITNSVKHAGTGNGTAIKVACRRKGERMCLTIADNGPGFPPGFRLERATGFGMRMARSVVAQAKGELRLVDAPSGAVVEIAVPLVRQEP